VGTEAVRGRLEAAEYMAIDPRAYVAVVWQREAAASVPILIRIKTDRGQVSTDTTWPAAWREGER
jgi:hypothetical protein